MPKLREGARKYPQDERNAGDLREQRSAWQQLLRRYEHREANDPKQVHHAPHEEQSHQHPAATDAKCAMDHAKPERAFPSRPPVTADELPWRAALTDARR